MTHDVELIHLLLCFVFLFFFDRFIRRVGLCLLCLKKITSDFFFSENLLKLKSLADFAL